MISKLNPELTKYLDSELFGDIIRVVEVVGFPIYFSEMETSDFSRIHKWMSAMHTLGKKAAKRFEIVIVMGNETRRLDYLLMGMPFVKEYIAQIVKEYPEIVYFLGTDTVRFVAMTECGLKCGRNGYGVSDGKKYLNTIERFSRAAEEYEKSLEE